ncbi:MAG: hypothetical protein M8867_04310 [marine benthic group bacterium]|nr:hypothetical protein [Gemmatimonadota bacterium]
MSGWIAGRAALGFAGTAVLVVLGGCAGGAAGPGPAAGPGAPAQSPGTERIETPPAGDASGGTGADVPSASGPDPEWLDPDAAIRPPEEAPAGGGAASPSAPLTLRAPGSSIPSGFPVKIEASEGTDGPPWRGPLHWSSDDLEVVRITDSGVATGYLPGVARISVVPEAGPGDAARDTARVELRVVPDPARILTVSPARANVLAGEVLHLTAEVRTIDGRELEDAWVHWSATPIAGELPARIEPDGSFVAPEAGTWLATATRGRLSATAVVDVGPRPGAEALSLLASALPPGPAATFAGLRVFEGMDGRDWAWVWTDPSARIDLWDISDTGSPAFVRSLDPGADRVHDVEIGAGGGWAVVALSGPTGDDAGLAVYDLSRPSEPRPIARVGGDLSGGASAVAVDRDRVWAAAIGDGSLVGFDLTDPAGPRRIGRWQASAARHGHIADLEVRDGLAFLARWDDGVAILDVGAGNRGGTPAAPALVAELPNPVFSDPGPEGSGAVRAYRVRRWRDWLLVGESIVGCRGCETGPRGGVRLIDLTDLEQPVQRAWYHVPDAGVRDLEVDTRAERLTAAFGTGGARRLDVAGELRGDLYSQGRETAAAATGAWHTGVPSRSLARGARVLKGSLFVADMYAGLKVFRVESLTEMNDRESTIEP